MRPAVDRGDEVGQAAERRLPFALPLLAEHVERGTLRASATRRCRRRCRRRRSWPGRSRRRRGPSSSLLVDDLVEQLAGRRRTACVRLVADVGSSKIVGILALQLPGQEERRPVDVRDDLVEREVVEHCACRGTRACRCAASAQSVAKRLRERLGVGHELPLLPSASRLSRSRLLQRAVLAVEARLACSGRSAARRRRRSARRPSTWTTVLVIAGAILTAVCLALVVAPPISSGIVEALPLHLAGDVDHLVEARRDQAREADHVDAFARGPSPGSSRRGPSRPGR